MVGRHALECEIDSGASKGHPDHVADSIKTSLVLQANIAPRYMAAEQSSECEPQRELINPDP